MTEKRIVMLVTMLGMTVGSCLPLVFGDNHLLDGWSLLGTFIGGMAGVYVGVKLAKRF